MAPLSRIALIASPLCLVDPNRWAMIPYAAPESDAARRGGCLMSRVTPGCPAQQLAHHVAVVEGVHDPVDLLAGLVALARDHDDVARPGQRQRGGDGRPPVALLEHLGAVPVRAPSSTAARIAAGVLGARVVVGDDDHVGEPRRELAHDRALAGVAVTAGPEDDEEPALGERPQALQRGLGRRPACGRSRRRR